MPLAKQFCTRCLMLSLLTSVHLYLMSTQLAFYHPFDYHREIGSCEWYFLLSVSLTPFPRFLSLLLHLSSGFKRLSNSLALRSNWPLPFICQPFDAVPAWAACYALPLTARTEVRGGLYFKTPPHLNTPYLPYRCVCLWYPLPSSSCLLLASSLP